MALCLSGGNIFILRMAMRISGFDTVFPQISEKKDFLWGGYSAGSCMLANTLKPIEIVDDPNIPYKEIDKAVYEGLGNVIII